MANASAPVEGRAEFRVGDQLARSFALLGSHFWLVFLLVLPPAAASTLLGSVTESGEALPGRGTVIVLAIIGIIVSVACYSISQAMIAHAAVQAMRGRRVQLAETLSVSLPRAIPVLILSVLAGLLTALASLLLLIPGLMAATMLFVSQPACVVERRGPIASMSRSAELTKGYRWKVFGVIVLMVLIEAVVGGVIGLAFRGLGGISGSLVSTVWNALTMAFDGVVCAVVYHDLRVVKEGVDIEQIAAVFGRN